MSSLMMLVQAPRREELAPVKDLRKAEALWVMMAEAAPVADEDVSGSAGPPLFVAETDAASLPLVELAAGAGAGK